MQQDIVVAVPVTVIQPPPEKKKSCCHQFLRTPGRRCIFSLVMYVVIALAFLFGLLFGLVLKDDPKPTVTPDVTTTPMPKAACVGKEASYKSAAVASDAPVCSKVGRDILEKKGGSAADGAVATLICLGMANVQAMGSGGGFLMTLYEKKSGTAFALDSREVAPLAATEDMYVDGKASSSNGGKSIAVPGEIAGYQAVHKKYGKLKWKELFEPTIKLCKEGVPVTVGLSDAMQLKESVIRADAKLSARFINPKTKKLYKLGEKILYPGMAKTLQTLADEGADAYYKGSLTKDIVADIKDAGGIITEKDLNDYKPKWRTPVSLTLENADKLKVYSLPPPSSGAIMEYILNILDGYKFTADDFKNNALRTYQRIEEAFKFAYARRAELGDQDFVDVTQILANLTSAAYAAETRKFITDDKTHERTYYGKNMGQIGKQGTSHLSLMASNGDTVSVTSTINHYFGSKVIGSRTSILFNNQMDDFSTPGKSNSFGLPPSPTNFIKPGKRPMSSMSPSIVVDAQGNVKLAIGASGGSMIISSTAYCAARILMFGESLKDGIDAPRAHNQWVPNKIVYDPTFPKDILKGLENIGHKTEQIVGKGAVVQGVYTKGTDIFAYSDTRRDGCPSGY